MMEPRRVGVVVGPATCSNANCRALIYWGIRTVGRGNTAQIKMWRNADGRPHTHRRGSK